MKHKFNQDEYLDTEDFAQFIRIRSSLIINNRAKYGGVKKYGMWLYSDDDITNANKMTVKCYDCGKSLTEEFYSRYQWHEQSKRCRCIKCAEIAEELNTIVSNLSTKFKFLSAKEIRSTPELIEINRKSLKIKQKLDYEKNR